MAGILLGPTLLGALAPGIQAHLFPAQVVPLLAAVADLGLALYMFLVGLELDPRLLRGRLAQAAFVATASVAVPLLLGIALALRVPHAPAPEQLMTVHPPPRPTPTGPTRRQCPGAPGRRARAARAPLPPACRFLTDGSPPEPVLARPTIESTMSRGGA